MRGMPVPADEYNPEHDAHLLHRAEEIRHDGKRMKAITRHLESMRNAISRNPKRLRIKKDR